jgi:hypothetical protein
MKIGAFILAFLLAAWTVRGSAAQDQAAAPYESTENTGTLYGQVDVSCIVRTFRITGTFACPAFPSGVNVCIIVENAYPVGVLEAVRRPYTTHLSEGESTLKALKAEKAHGESSSHTTDQASGTGLQFTEVHAYQFVPDLGMDSAYAVPSGPSTAEISYVSELDGYSWRTGLADILAMPFEALQKAGLPACSTVPRILDCAWSWGSYFPRIGFAQHPSEVMAGFLLAVRGGRVAAMPGTRVVLGSYPNEPRTGHYLQMVRPTWRSCISIGWPITRMVEAAALSPEGAYLFVQFSIFRKCNGCFPAILVEPRPPAP